MKKTKVIFTLALNLVLATALFAGSASRVVFSNSNDNRPAELKAQMLELMSQGKYDATLWDEYRSLTTTDKPANKLRHRNSLDQGGDVCGSATVIGALPYTDSGTTFGYANDYDSTYFNDAPDVVYSYTSAVNQTVDADLCGSFFDTVLLLYTASCAGPATGRQR